MEFTPGLAFLTGSAGPGELLFIFIIILVFFGPKRLPELARMIGRAMTELRRASQEFRHQVMTMEDTPAAPEQPPPSFKIPALPPEGQLSRETAPVETAAADAEEKKDATTSAGGPGEETDPQNPAGG